MTASNVAATRAVAYAFLDAHYPWLPKPEITEWDNAAGGLRYYTGKDGASIAVPKYSDAWNDARPEVVIHECGHVLAFYLASKGVPVVEQFLAAFGVPTFTDPLINEVFAEHFVRSYVQTYDGYMYPQLVGLVPFDAAKMRGFSEGLRDTSVSPPTTTVVRTTAVQPEWVGPLPADHWMAGRDGTLIDRIVIHTTVGTASAAEARFRVKIRVPADQVSAHFIVRWSGEISQLVSTGDTAYHAGDWDMNLRSIGIEHVDNGDYDGVRPDALYAASASLVRDLCTTHGIPIDRTHIVAHREVSATKCPDALDIERIVREAGGDMAFKDDPDAQAFKNDMLNWQKAVNDRLSKDAHHKHPPQTVTVPESGEPEGA